jgi:hypothetical protein
MNRTITGPSALRRAFSVALALALPAFAQDPRPPAVLQKDVDDAIKRGADFLMAKAKEGLPGDVPINGGKGLNYNGLVLYTLLHAGVDKDDGTVQRLAETVKNEKPARTYNVSMAACALAHLDANKYREQLAIWAQWLSDTQCDNGQWSYGEAYDVPMPKVPTASGSGTGGNAAAVKFPVKRSKRVGPASGDNSNSQYAALGMWACSRAGVEFDSGVVDAALKWWEGCQQPDGGWGYNENGKFDEKHGTYGAMTAGGAGSLVILRKLKGHDPKSSAAKKGIAWLGANWSVEKHPRSPADREMFHYYHLYAVERLGDLFGTEKMGKWTWYAEGADWLLKQQRGGAWWGKDQGWIIADTCFAILFLHRSMAVKTVNPFEKPK